MVDASGRVSAETFLNTSISRIVGAMATPTGRTAKAYNNDKEWTKLLTQSLRVACERDLGCESVMQEFWPRVDIAAFDKCEDENWTNWAFDIAIEIENNSETWEEECHKLMLLSCGLKVLISYYGDETRLRDRVAELPKKIAARKYCRPNEEWLLLFLPWSGLSEEESIGLAFRVFNERVGDDFEPTYEELRRIDLRGILAGFGKGKR